MVLNKDFFSWNIDIHSKIVDKEIVCRAFGSNKNKVEEILTKYINGTSVYDV